MTADRIDLRCATCGELRTPILQLDQAEPAIYVACWTCFDRWSSENQQKEFALANQQATARYRPISGVYEFGAVGVF